MAFASDDYCQFDLGQFVCPVPTSSPTPVASPRYVPPHRRSNSTPLTPSRPPPTKYEKFSGGLVRDQFSRLRAKVHAELFWQKRQIEKILRRLPKLTGGRPDSKRRRQRALNSGALSAPALPPVPEETGPDPLDPYFHDVAHSPSMDNYDRIQPPILPNQLPGTRVRGRFCLFDTSIDLPNDGGRVLFTPVTLPAPIEITEDPEPEIKMITSGLPPPDPLEGDDEIVVFDSTPPSRSSSFWSIGLEIAMVVGSAILVNRPFAKASSHPHFPVRAGNGR